MLDALERPVRMDWRALGRVIGIALGMLAIAVLAFYGGRRVGLGPGEPSTEERARAVLTTFVQGVRDADPVALRAATTDGALALEEQGGRVVAMRITKLSGMEMTPMAAFVPVDGAEDGDIQVDKRSGTATATIALRDGGNLWAMLGEVRGEWKIIALDLAG